jgi:Putative metallopeptidase
MVSVLNKRVALPRDVAVEIKDCGVVNAFYHPRTHSISMCHELTNHLIALFKKAGLSDKKAAYKAELVNIFIFYHESGHMLINELNLPITGKEEDVADQFSAFALLNSRELKQDAPEILGAAADWFKLEGTRFNSDSFMNEHSLNAQRFYSLVCTLYVSDPDAYAPVVSKMGYSSKRLRKCRKEYNQMTRTWKILLRPYIKTQADIRKIEKSS